MYEKAEQALYRIDCVAGDIERVIEPDAILLRNYINFLEDRLEKMSEHISPLLSKATIELFEQEYYPKDTNWYGA